MDIYPGNIPSVKELKCKYSNDLQILVLVFYISEWSRVWNLGLFFQSFLKKNPQLFGIYVFLFFCTKQIEADGFSLKHDLKQKNSVLGIVC